MTNDEGGGRANWETCSMEVLEAASDPHLTVRYTGMPSTISPGDTASVVHMVERGRSVDWVKQRLEETCAAADQVDGWMDFAPLPLAPIQYMYADIECDGVPVFTRYCLWMWNWWRIENGKEPLLLPENP
jgi:hypothetical protein